MVYRSGAPRPANTSAPLQLHFFLCLVFLFVVGRSVDAADPEIVHSVAATPSSSPITLGGRLQLGLNVDNNFGHLREGNFVQRLWQLQFAYAWNPNVVLTSFIQYDSESQNFGANTRLRWTFKPAMISS